MSRKSTPRRKRAAFGLATLMIAGTVTIAQADNVNVNQIDDNTAGTETIAAGSDGTVGFKVVVNSAGGDDESGCNANTTSPLSITIDGLPAGITQLPDPLTLSNCEANGPGGFTNMTLRVAAGTPACSYPVTIDLDDRGGDSGYHLTREGFTIVVTGTTACPDPNPVVDSTPPAKPVVDLAASSDLGTSDTDDITKDDTPTFSIAAEAGSTVKVFDGTTLLGTATEGSAGGFSYTSSDLADGSHAITATATDSADNTSVAADALSVLIDTLDPTTDPASDITNTVWRNTSLSQSYTADGTGSALADPTNDAAFTLVASSESTNSSTPTVDSNTIADVAGNSITRSISALIDLSDPLLDITDTNAASYSACDSSRPSRPSFQPSDPLSGLDAAQTSSNWSAPANGLGSYFYSATATDNAGNTDAYSGSYSVTYGGAFGGVLQPINATGTPSRFKLGSTIPVKFQIMCGSTPVDNAVARLTVKKTDSTANPGVDEAISTAAATTGNLFRYDATAQQYIFNLSTKSGFQQTVNGVTSTVAFTTGSWTLGILLDDGTSRTVNIEIPK